jgi:uncharacterized protein YlxP (DUF503 family)
MIVGVMKVDLAVFDARSLKDKRRVIQSVKQRLRDRFNVSVAEVDYGDLTQRCLLGIALVCDESRAVHAQLDKMVELLRHTAGLSLLNYERELL